MSLSGLKAFLAQVDADESLRRDLARSGPDGVPLEALALIAAARGFQVDLAGLKDELSDAALDAVAGGTGGSAVPVDVAIGTHCLLTHDGRLKFKD